MSATDILWPRPRLCYIHSCQWYITSILYAFIIFREIAVVGARVSRVEGENKHCLTYLQRPFALPPSPCLLRYDALCMLTTLNSILHFYCILMTCHKKNMKAGWYIYTRQFKFIGIIKFLLSGLMSHAQFGLVFCKFPSLIYWWDLLALIVRKELGQHWSKTEQGILHSSCTPLVHPVVISQDNRVSIKGMRLHVNEKIKCLTLLRTFTSSWFYYPEKTTRFHHDVIQFLFNIPPSRGEPGEWVKNRFKVTSEDFWGKERMLSERCMPKYKDYHRSNVFFTTKYRHQNWSIKIN